MHGDRPTQGTGEGRKFCPVSDCLTDRRQGRKRDQAGPRQDRKRHETRPPPGCGGRPKPLTLPKILAKNPKKGFPYRQNSRHIFEKKFPCCKKILEILGIGLGNPPRETKPHQEIFGNGHKKPPNRGGTGGRWGVYTPCERSVAVCSA